MRNRCAKAMVSRASAYKTLAQNLSLSEDFGAGAPVINRCAKAMVLRASAYVASPCLSSLFLTIA